MVGAVAVMLIVVGKINISIMGFLGCVMRGWRVWNVLCDVVERIACLDTLCSLNLWRYRLS